MSDTAALIGAAVAEASSASASASEPSSQPSTPSESGSPAEASPAAATETPSPAASSPEPAPTEQAPTDDSAISPAEKVQGAIPTHRHQAVVTKLRNEHKAALEAKDAELQSLAWAKSDPDAVHKLSAMSLAETEPKRFLGVLQRLMPEVYGKLQWADEAPPSQPASVATSVAPAAGRPEPDIELEDGRRVYSSDAQAKLDEWKEAQYEQRMKTALDERFRPMDEQKRATEMFTTAVNRTKPLLENFRATKPLFKENEAAIKAAVAANIKDYDAAVKYGKTPPPLMSLHEAYIEVVIPKLLANRDQMRADLLAEINSRPAPATLRPVAQQPAATGTGGGSASTADLIRSTLSR